MKPLHWLHTTKIAMEFQVVSTQELLGPIANPLRKLEIKQIAEVAGHSQPSVL